MVGALGGQTHAFALIHMLELVFELLGELILQFILQALVEAGGHAFAGKLNRPVNPWLAALGYAAYGAMVGGLSLLVFPHYLVPAPWRIANTLITPVAAGLLMSAVGAWRERHGQDRIRIDRFSYGYLFALSLGLVRLMFAG